MALHKQTPAPVVRYITVQDAIDRIGVSERTMRRWIEEAEDSTIDDKKKKVHNVVRDPSGFVRLDLDEVERIVQVRQGVAPSLHQRIDALGERIEELENDKAAQAKKVSELQGQIEGILHALAGLQGTYKNDDQALPLTELLALLPLHRRASTQEPWEKRGLPPGTMRLVNFSKLHQVNLWDLKQRSFTGEIPLEIYHREAEAKRNKQEWWVTPAQHQQIAAYCQEHALPYTPCPQCTAVIQEDHETIA